MRIRPRVLVIDDLIGSESVDELTRENQRIYCASLGLQPESTASIDLIVKPVAEAVFTSGQRMTQRGLENSLELVDAAFRSGWPTSDGRFWSAVLVDMRF